MRSTPSSTYSSEYGRDASLPGRRHNYRRRIALLEESLSNVRGRGLDVGAADGDYASELTAPRREVICLDLRFGLASSARSRHGLSAVRGTATHLPFSDEAFDFVYVLNALRYFSSPERALREVHRVLARGGVLFLLCHNLLCPDVFFARKGGGQYLTLDMTARMLAQLGFQILRRGYFPLVPPSFGHRAALRWLSIMSVTSRSPWRILLPEFYVVARKGAA